MGIRFLGMSHAKKTLWRSLLASATTANIPKGHIAVYVGETQKRRFVVPISYLNHHLFQDLLTRAEEEFGFNHPMGGLTIPCSEYDFIGIASSLNSS